MARREDKGRMGSFARGSELWMHQARLFVVAIGTVVLLSVLVGLAVTSGYFWHATTAAEKYALERNVLARTRDVLGMTAGKMELHIEGQLRLLEVEQVARLTQALAEEGWRKLRNGGLFGVLSAAGFVFLVSLYWWGYGRAKMQDRQLRGAQLVAGPELAMLVRQRKEASPYEIAGVPMRLKSETLHTLLAGAQGTGKSQQFFALMKQVRAQGKRMIVYDPTGEFTQAFYRAGKDILMNPLDARSPNWNVWQEIAKDYHYDNIANGLIPDPARQEQARGPAQALAGNGGRELCRPNHRAHRHVARGAGLLPALRDLWPQPGQDHHLRLPDQAAAALHRWGRGQTAVRSDGPGRHLVTLVVAYGMQTGFRFSISGTGRKQWQRRRQACWKM